MNKWILILSTLIFFNGCATIKESAEALKYQPDTPILVNEKAYQIHLFKCAEIRAVDEDDRLICYDPQGNQSASISPVADFRVEHLASRNMTWGSAEHQAYMYDYLYNGGQERNLANLESSINQFTQALNTTKSLLKTIDASREIESQKFEMNMKGVEAYMKGGKSGWMVFQSHRVNWHLSNSQYFANKE